MGSNCTRDLPKLRRVGQTKGIGDPEIGATLEERSDDLELPRAHGIHQHGLAALRDHVDVGLSVADQIECGLVASSEGGQVQGRFARVVLGIDDRRVHVQDAGHRGDVALHRFGEIRDGSSHQQMQGGVPPRCRQARVGPVVQQQADDLKVGVVHRKVQGSPFPAIGRPEVDRVAHQGAHKVREVQLNGQQQRRESLGVRFFQRGVLDEMEERGQRVFSDGGVQREGGDHGGGVRGRLYWGVRLSQPDGGDALAILQRQGLGGQLGLGHVHEEQRGRVARTRGVRRIGFGRPLVVPRRVEVSSTSTSTSGGGWVRRQDGGADGSEEMMVCGEGVESELLGEEDLGWGGREVEIRGGLALDEPNGLQVDGVPSTLRE